jgi:hypothetical protein
MIKVVLGCKASDAISLIRGLRESVCYLAANGSRLGTRRGRTHNIPTYQWELGLG